MTMKDLGPHCRVASSTTVGTIKQFDKQSKTSAKLDQSSPIHDLLCARLDKEGIAHAREVSDAIPGRAFRLDVGIMDQKLGIEVDGWQNHGKTKAGFQKDREKQNLYTEAGWRILRYTAADIYKNLDGCIAQIKRCCERSEPEYKSADRHCLAVKDSIQ